MNIEITSYNNQFKIKGVLNRQNVNVFTSEFKNIFEKFNSLTLSIEGLTSIDRYGVNALAQLHNESISKQKSLSIIGMGCDDLYEHFKSEEEAA
jgi:anti-anti-sigma regulatory factor